MRSTIVSAVLLAATSMPLSLAQTFTDCDPTKKSDCPNDKAIAASFESNFVGQELSSDWKVTNGQIKAGPNGAEFTINKKGEAPTIQTNAYLHFGKVEVTMRAAPGTGIISSIVLESDNLDEVDWEFRGGFEGKVQSNYFGKGNTTTYDRMIEYDVAAAQTMSHSYAVDWTKDAISWIINGKTVRTLKYADANGGSNFPQTPMNVRLGVWAGGDPDGNSPGTVEWAAGPGKQTDFGAAPFTMYVESVKITNYSPGCEYKYGDMSGSYQSIQVISSGCTTNNNAASGGIFAPSATGKGNSTGNGSTAALGGTSTCTSKTETVTVTVPPGQQIATPSTLTSTVRLTSTITNVRSTTSRVSSSASPPEGPILTDTSSFPVPTTRPTVSRNVTAPPSTATPSLFNGDASRTSGMGLTAVVLGMLGMLAL